MNEIVNNKYPFESHLSEKAKLWISLINQSYARFQDYKKDGDAAVHPIDKEKGLEKCKRMALEDIKYHLDKLKTELDEKDFKHYLNYNLIMINEVEKGILK